MFFIRKTTSSAKQIRVSERSGLPVRKKCSNQVRSPCFHATNRAATALGFPNETGAMGPVASDVPGNVGAEADRVPGIEGAETAPRGVKSTFMNGEIIPIVTPLDSANPTMRKAVRIKRPRYGLR